MKKYTIIIILTFLYADPIYDIDSQILDPHLMQEYSYCYPEDSLGIAFKFSDYYGKVIMIDMSASW